jgi:hypothetical protein
MRLLPVRCQPIQIQTIGVELGAAGGNQASGAGVDELIYVCVNLVEKLRRETVFVVAKVEDRNVLFVGQAYSHDFLP